MEKRKICLLGATGVGKTSLVTRYVRSLFSGAYRTTIGVTIEKKHVQCCGRDIDLLIWDLTGEDEFQAVNLAYTRSAAGFLVVVDGTRRETAETALRLFANARATSEEAKGVFVFNKSDLSARWEIDERTEKSFESTGFPLIKTSAKTGAGVEVAFNALVREILRDGESSSRDGP